MPAQIFGAQAAVSMLNRAFSNASPSNAVFNNQVANAAATLASGADASNLLSYTGFAKTFGSAYASQTPAALSTLLMTNMGLLPNAALETALADYITSVGTGNVGIVALQLGKIISGLEGDATYGTAAVAWNNEVTAAFTYSSNASNTTTQTGDVVTPPATQGQTYTLTKGLDNVAGTNGDDTVLGAIDNSNAELNTLSNLDIIGGGAGNDTLKIAHGGTAAATALGNLTSVEIVTIESASTGGITVDASAVTGLTNLNITKAAAAVSATAGATTNTSVAVKTQSVTANGGNNVNVNLTDSDGSAGVIAVGGTTAAKGDVVVAASGKAAVNGTDYTMGTIAVTGGKTISITQAVGSASGLVGGATATTHTQGAVTATAGADTTTVTVKQDAAVANGSVKAVTKVDEVATVTFTKLTSGQSATVGGLTFTAGKDLTADQVAAAFAGLTSTAPTPTNIAGPTTATGDTNGGSAKANGTFTGALLAKWSSAAASSNTVTFTGTGAMTDLTVGGTGTSVATSTQGVDAVTGKNTLGVVAGTVTVAGGAALATVNVDGFANSTGAAGVTGGTNTALATISLANGGNFEVDSAATTLALALNKVSGTVDIQAGTKTLNATVTSGTTDTATLKSASAEAINVSGTGSVAGTTAGGGLTAATAISTTGMTAGKAAFTINDGTATSYAGGAGVDTLTVANAGTAISKAISLGAGNDKLVLNGSVAVPTVTLDGGDGTDTLSMTGASAESLTAASTFAGKLTGFEKLEVTGIVGGQTDTINMSNVGGLTYVVSSGSTASTPTQEIQTFTVTNGVTATKTNQVQALDFTGITINAGGTITVGGISVTVAGSDTAFAVASKVALAMNGATAVTGNTGSNAVVASAVGAVVNVTFHTAASGPAALTSSLGTATLTAGTMPTATVSTPYAANAVSLTVGGVAVTLDAQAKTAAGAVVARSGDDTTTEVATKVVAALDANGTYNAAGTSNAGADVTVKYAANADVANITSTLSGGVTFGAVTEATKGSAGVTLGDLTLTNAASGGTLELTAAGGVSTITLKDATGSTDSYNLVTTVTTADIAFGTVDVAGVETLKLTATDTTVPPTTGATVDTASLTLKADKATSLTIDGTSNVTLTLDAATNKLATIDASALTGKLTASANAGVAMTITGGAGADVLAASAGTTAKADVLVGGAGKDVLTAGSNGATLTGGADADIFKLTASSGTTGNKESNTYSTVTDLSAGDVVQLQYFDNGAGAARDVTGFAKLSAVLNEGTATFANFVDAAIAQAGAGEAVYFSYQSNAYIVVDSNTNSASTFANTEDLIIKLTGINGDNLSWNSTHATVSLI